MMRRILLFFILPYAGWNFNFYCVYSGFSYRLFTAYFREDWDIRLPKVVGLCFALLLGFAIFHPRKTGKCFLFSIEYCFAFCYNF